MQTLESQPGAAGDARRGRGVEGAVTGPDLGDRLPAAGIGVVALLALAAYASTPLNYWVGDDYNYLSPKGIDRIISFFDPTVPTRAFYRPLNWTSWAVDYGLWGTVPFGWHLTSIAMNVAATVAVTLIVWLILRRANLAVLVGALFAVHPAHTETVTWIGGRADLVCGLFYFPAVLFFVLYLLRRERDRSGRVYYALALLCLVGAIMGKEMGVTVPVAFLLVDAFFFTPRGKDWSLDYWRRRLPLHIPLFAVVLAYLLMRYLLVATGVVTNTYAGPGMLSLRGLLNATASNILLLIGVWTGPDWVLSWPMPASAALAAVALVAALLAVRWLGRAGVFALLWTALTVLPTANLSALRWLYVPSFGICLLGGLAVARLADLRRPASTGRGPAWYAGGALVLAWALGVVAQNVVWYRSGEEARSMLSQIKALAPDPPRPATIYFAGAPYSYGSALLFNTGLPSAMSLVYPAGGVELHEVEQPLADPVIEAALANPPRLKPNPLFMGYKSGQVHTYPSLDALLQAGTGK